MTGGIAVGKTVMMNYWKSQYDIPIFDLDDVGRDLLKDEGLKKSISVIFGLEVFNESGDIDRLSLQSRIFSNKDEKIQLESLLHPKIRQISREKVSVFLEKHSFCLVITPLLYETNAMQNYDRVCLVDSPLDQRVRRCFDRGLSEEMILAILNAQATTKERFTISDDVLSNMKDLSFFYGQIDRLYQKYLEVF